MEKNINKNLQVPKKKSCIIRNELQAPRNNFQVTMNESQIDNKFIDNMRSMIDLLLQSVNKISGINKKISIVDGVKADNKFIDNMRSMIDLLLKSVNKISEIDQK